METAPSPTQTASPLPDTRPSLPPPAQIPSSHAAGANSFHSPRQRYPPPPHPAPAPRPQSTTGGTPTPPPPHTSPLQSRSPPVSSANPPRPPPPPSPYTPHTPQTSPPS